MLSTFSLYPCSVCLHKSSLVKDGLPSQPWPSAIPKHLHVVPRVTSTWNGLTSSDGGGGANTRSGNLWKSKMTRKFFLTLNFGLTMTARTLLTAATDPERTESCLRIQTRRRASVRLLIHSMVHLRKENTTFAEIFYEMLVANLFRSKSSVGAINSSVHLVLHNGFCS